jgi:hypothetical protein
MAALGARDIFMRNDDNSIIIGFQICLILLTGLALAYQVINAPAAMSLTTKLVFSIYAVVFLSGSIAYYIWPRLGSIALIIGLLSLIIAAPLLPFPMWANASIGNRIALIIGTIISAGIVSKPLITFSEKEAPNQ